MSGLPLQQLVSTFLAFTLTAQVSAQTFRTSDPDKDSLLRYIEMNYGLDQELYTGFHYSDRFKQYKGNPFFPEDSFIESSLRYKGIQYDHVSLKYDCHSQYLVLEYADFEDRYNRLILDSKHIESFWLGTHRFQKLSLNGEKPLFYQILSSGPVSCYVHWKKSLISISNDWQYLHEFSEPLGEFLIRYNGQIKSVTNRDSYLSLFPESLHREIKKYFRQQRFTFRAADLIDIQKLLLYTSQLEPTRSEQ